MQPIPKQTGHHSNSWRVQPKKLGPQFASNQLDFVKQPQPKLRFCSGTSVGYPTALSHLPLLCVTGPPLLGFSSHLRFALVYGYGLVARGEVPGLRLYCFGQRAHHRTFVQARGAPGLRDAAMAMAAHPFGGGASVVNNWCTNSLMDSVSHYAAHPWRTHRGSIHPTW